MNDKQDKPKKKLQKSGYQFDPIVTVEQPKVAVEQPKMANPYYPPNRNEILDYLPQPFNEIDINYHPKQKKQLRPSTYKIEISQSVDQQVNVIQEEEKQRQLARQKEEEKLREEQQFQQARLPKPYTKSSIEEIFSKFEDFSYFESHQLWKVLGDRKHHDYKDLKRFENRKESKVQTQKKEPKLEKQFDRKPEIQKIQIIRLVENIDQKQKKDEMKQLAEAWNQKLKEVPEEEKIFQREITYRLNQLAPENFDTVSKYIVDQIIQRQVQCNFRQDKTDFLAEKIIEKSQIEPKYRKLYTKLCGLLVNQPKLLVQRPGKNPQSKFKASLLNNVQKIFRNRKQANEEAKLDDHIIRKNKIMGNVRFIGDLYIESILPFKALGLAVSELIGEYIYKDQCNTNEESIEGLIELIDQIGFNLSQKKQVKLDEKSIQDLNQILNGSKPDQKLFFSFFEQFKENVYLDLITRWQIVCLFSFQLLVKNFNLSQRIRLLIENLQDKQKQGWQGSYVKKEDEESLEQEEDDPLEISARKGKSYQEVIYVEKSYPAIDLNDVSVYVASSFNMESEQQEQALKNELKRICESREALQKFYDIFFQNLFSYKLIKKNLERAQIVFELLAVPESSEEIVRKSIQNTLNEDLVYNLCESKAAQELVVDILAYFLNEQDWGALKKFYLKPDLEVEDFKDFIVKVSNNLLEKFPEKSAQELIQRYFKHLDFEINF